MIEAAYKLRFDLRKLPKLAVSGPGTAMVLESHGLFPDAIPDRDFGNSGLAAVLKEKIRAGEHVMRLCSNAAGPELTASLTEFGAELTDCRFYNKLVIKYASIPEFSAVLFTSPASVRAFIENFTASALKHKKALAIGKPTRLELEKLNVEVSIITASEAALRDMVFALALDSIF